MARMKVTAGVETDKGLTRIRRQKKQRMGIAEPGVRRLARKAGIRRMNHQAVKAFGEFTTSYLRTLLDKSYVFCKHGGRKTIYAEDIVSAAALNGEHLLGY